MIFNMLILITIQVESQTASCPSSLLKPVLSNHFELTTLLSELTMEQFCDEKQILKDNSVFLELNANDKKKDYVDVMLLDKVSRKID